MIRILKISGLIIILAFVYTCKKSENPPSSDGQTGTVTDIEGNIYNTVTIGTQTWMAENLKTTKYNDGTTIPNVTDWTAWAALTTPSYCWYNNDATTYKATYGALYNWYTVNSTSNGGKNVCPTSWHVPTDAEWTTLTTYLGGESVAGGKLKETGTAHYWISPNIGATNETGFTALPGGYRYYSGAYSSIGSYGLWWSSTETSSTSAWGRHMHYAYSDVLRTNFNKPSGFSVRCSRDF
jgi:Fibrobacter succinogenes major domain (Fib_succ_major).